MTSPSRDASPLLAERFAARAAEQPEAPAIVAAAAVGDASAVTYGTLAREVEAIAAAVAGHRRIALLPRSDAASVAAVLGAMRAGTSVVLLHRHVTAQQLARVWDLAEPQLLVASGRLPAPLQALGADPVTPAELAAAAPAPVVQLAAASPAPAAAAPHDELLVGLTSGTSGEPKLFVRDQASWAATLDRSDAAFALGRGDRVAAPGPLDHTHFLYGALHALTRGAAVDLRPLEQTFGNAAAPALTAAAPADADAAITHAYVVPTLAADLVDLLDARPQAGARLRTLISSAAPWPEEARERLAETLPQTAITHFYGASELSFVAFDDERGAGRPFAGVEIEIRADDGQRLPDGEQGTVHVRSDMLFSGYLTADGIADGPDPDGWATVGDLGTLRDGRLSLAGRGSDTIVCGGLNVEPAEVELAFAALPGVAEVACAGLPDARLGAIPVVVLVLAPGRPAPSRVELRAHARATLPQPSRPRRAFVADALPRSPRGKLLRAELAAQLAAGTVAELT